MLFANRGESLMNDREHCIECSGFSASPGQDQPWPAFHRMEAEPAFVAQPALIDIHVSAADRSVDLAICCGLARNAATHRSCGMVDPKVATRAATAADRAGSL